MVREHSTVATRAAPHASPAAPCPTHQLAQFAVPHDYACHRGTLQPLVERQRHSSERKIEEVEVDDRHLQQQRQCDSAPKPRVREQVCESTRGFRARVEGIKQVSEDENREARGARRGEVVCALD